MPNNTLTEIQPGFGRDALRRAHPLGPIAAELQDHVEDLEDLIGENTDIQDNADAITDLQEVTHYRDLEVTFEASEVGIHKLWFEDAVTITKIRAQVTAALAATDNGTITLKNSANAAMANGAITFMASDPFGTVGTATVPTTLNTVTAGDFIEVVTAKTTPGGRARVTVEYTVTP